MRRVFPHPLSHKFTGAWKETLVSWRISQGCGQGHAYCTIPEHVIHFTILYMQNPSVFIEKLFCSRALCVSGIAGRLKHRGAVPRVRFKCLVSCAISNSSLATDDLCMHFCDKCVFAV